MAERRMFAKTIVDSDMFLDMPLSAQALYFHLSMRADDDGFINNSRKIQRMIGASDDDLKLLFAKSYVIPFESGIVVIKHWRIHNYIQKDRYNETVYKSEKAQLEIEQNNAYSLCATQTITNALDAQCIQDVSIVGTQVRLGKVSKGKSIKHICADDAQANDRFERFWEAYPKKIDKKRAQKTFRRINPDDELLAVMIEAIKQQKLTDSWCREAGQFIPYPATWLNGERWNDNEEDLQGKKVLTSQSGSGVLKLASMIQNGEFDDEPQGNGKAD